MEPRSSDEEEVTESEQSSGEEETDEEDVDSEDELVKQDGQGEINEAALGGDQVDHRCSVGNDQKVSHQEPVLSCQGDILDTSRTEDGGPSQVASPSHDWAHL